MAEEPKEGFSFADQDLPPIDDESLDFQNRGEGPDTMISLAYKMAGFAKERLNDSPGFPEDDEEDLDLNFHRLFLCLGKAATQCSDMGTYVRVSVWLFLAGFIMCDKIAGQFPADDHLPDCMVVSRKFFRNYIALVLLGEGISTDERIAGN